MYKKIIILLLVRYVGALVFFSYNDKNKSKILRDKKSLLDGFGIENDNGLYRYLLDILKAD